MTYKIFLNIKLILITYGIVITSCKNKNKYILTIEYMDQETKKVTQNTQIIFAPDDTTAFKDGCREYWLYKTSVMEVSKKLEIKQPVPFYFTVETTNGTPIYFDKSEAERLTYSITKYFKEKVLPAIDTITPISKRPKREPANIY